MILSTTQISTGLMIEEKREIIIFISENTTMITSTLTTIVNTESK